MPKVVIDFESERDFHSLYQEKPANLKIIEEYLDVTIIARGGSLQINGNKKNLENCKECFTLLQIGKENGFVIKGADFLRFVKSIADGESGEFKKLFLDPLVLKIRKKTIVPRNLSQRLFLDLIIKHDLVFGIGPAGTGKTYLAMIMALDSLLKGHVKKIILARPAVEAGEALGFLPGDLEEKLLPYLRPLYDAMDEVLGPVEARKLVDSGVVEIAPLAYMRGRTLSNCFALLDEAQNATRSQMMMFLTRLGEGSKMVVTGDVTQIDLPPNHQSGLTEAKKTLKKVQEVKFHYFDHKDVVRHPLVSKIISAYQEG